VVEFDAGRGEKGLKAEDDPPTSRSTPRSTMDLAILSRPPTSISNCGTAAITSPRYRGNAFAIVAQQFDMRPNPTTGLISGAIYGVDG